MKNSLRLVYFSALLLGMIIIGCKSSDGNTSLHYSSIRGQTMGTYYGVKYSSDVDYQLQIDSILIDMNNSMSTYIDTAYISLINNNSQLQFDLDDPLFISFYEVFQEAEELYQDSDGYYDVSILPLVELYGFGSSGRKKSISEDSLAMVKNIIGMHNIQIDVADGKATFIKKDPACQLDFSSIAKGYAVDKIAGYLQEQGIENILVDIGGEQVLMGQSPSGSNWKIGINLPQEDADYNETILFLSLSDKALASSGNYRNYYVVDGKKFSHTINPKTGLSEDTDLLAVSVIAESCSRADAIATACMSMGFDRATQFIEKQNDAEACLFYLKQDSIVHHYSSDFAKYTFTQPTN